MNKKTVLISVLFAITIGIVGGVIIGAISGMFTPKSLDSTSKPSVSISDEKLPEEDTTNSDSSTDTTKDTTSETPKTNESSTKNDTPSTPAPQPTPAPTPQPTPAPQQPQASQSGSAGVVSTGNGQSLNIRSSSDPNSTIISGAGDGSSITIYERANGMARVKTADGVEGWVSEQYISG